MKKMGKEKDSEKIYLVKLYRKQKQNQIKT